MTIDNILIVSDGRNMGKTLIEFGQHGSYRPHGIQEQLEAVFPDANKQWCFRDYQLEKYFEEQGFDLGLVISNGMTKTRVGKYLEPVTCWSPLPFKLAKQYEIPRISPTFFGVYVPLIFRAKLELIKRFKK